MKKPVFPRLAVMVLASAALLSAGWPQTAFSLDASVAAIQNYDDRLILAMKQAAGSSAQMRYQRLAPILASAFDFATMTRLVVGPSWNSASPGQQAAMREAFARFMGAYYANRIEGYSGERFEVDPNAETRGAQKIVKTRLISGSGGTQINYLMSASRVVDIYLDGSISEIAARRSEFAGILGNGGPDALVKALQDRTAKLLGG